MGRKNPSDLINVHMMEFEGWSFTATTVNNFVDECINGNGKDDMIIFVIGSFPLGKEGQRLRGKNARFLKVVSDTMKTDRAGLVILKRGNEEPYSRILPHWSPATGPCVVIKGSVFRSVGKFREDFISFKYNMADFSHRANMQSIGITRLYYPGVVFDKVPDDRWAHLDKDRYHSEWSSILN
jgi:hypothetical protein